MVENVFKILTIFIIGIVGGIFADQIFWPYFVERPLFYQYRLEQSPIYLTERKEIIIQENVALKNGVEKVEKVVVGVKTQTKEGKILEGSGLILTSDGLVVTLADLVPRGSKFAFFWEGKWPTFQILKRDLKDNLALLKIGETNLPTASFANLEKIKLGERVFLVGVVFENKVPKKNVNEGIIKSLEESFIETNIFEKEKISGSPLFDIEGNVLGLNTVDKEGKITAIPISKIREFIGF